MLADKETEIPAFQTFFNYCLINIIFTSYTLYKYGIKGWFQMLWKNWWKCEFLYVCRFVNSV